MLYETKSHLCNGQSTYNNAKQKILANSMKKCLKEKNLGSTSNYGLWPIFF